jgi:hypothetical protein
MSASSHELGAWRTGIGRVSPVGRDLAHIELVPLEEEAMSAKAMSQEPKTIPKSFHKLSLSLFVPARVGTMASFYYGMQRVEC